ncbi:hypothetical protein STA3757_39370 [Stanieria sp. NIES-3757]|nr:hypothetical protein STA3757_39370 [Stanieria sp. NIES-3757]
MSLINYPKKSLYKVLMNPEQGRKYLKTALEHGNEQFFFFALHNLIDAIVYDLEITPCLETEEK